MFGEANINIEQLELQQFAISKLQGNVVLRQAAISERAFVTLGDFNADLSMNGDFPQAVIKDIDSGLNVSGQASLVGLRQLQYDLLIGIEDSTVPGLLEGFNTLGRIDENGQIRLRGSQHF